MGYYVTTTAVNVIIPLDNEAAALAEMKRINGPEFDDKKRGTSTTFNDDGTRTVIKSYSWMPEDFSGYTSLVTFLEDVGFQDTWVVNDHIELGCYDDKTGQEDVFLRFLAPFITAGSYIDWRGEEGEIFRWEFDGEKMAELDGKVVWQ